MPAAIRTTRPGITATSIRARCSASEPPAVAPLDTPFAGFDLLDPVLAELPATTHVVFLMSPVYQEFLDRELDPQIIADLPRCKAEVAERAAARPNTSFLDYLHESAISHDAENFMDTQHYRLNIARLLEARIAEVLNGGRQVGKYRRR